MSNVKEVKIHGFLPFDCHNDTDCAKLMAFCLAPVSGLQMTFTGHEEKKPNSHGGQDFFMEFHITGQEAVSWEWVKHVRGVIRRLGRLAEVMDVVDIEA